MSEEDQFRRVLGLVKRRFRPNRFVSVSRTTDRVRHQSAAFFRLVLELGSREVLPVIGTLREASPESSSRLASSIVLWWDRLLSRSKPRRLVVLVPSTWSPEQVDILRYLSIPLRCCSLDFERGQLDLLPPSSVDSAVDQPYVFHPLNQPPPELFEAFSRRITSVDLLFRNGIWQLSLRGLPLAWRSATGELLFDFHQPKDLKGMEMLLEHAKCVDAIRCINSPDPDHPFYRYGPERWLESQVLRHYRRLDARLGKQVYCQVPTWIGGQRKVIDLLTSTGNGQLAVLELKPEKDLGLLFQGLGYWDRVRRHLEAGDFERSGYFQGCRISSSPPLLFLVSPLFEFHRCLPTFRRYLDFPGKILCAGINVDWRQEIRIIRCFHL